MKSRLLSLAAILFLPVMALAEEDVYATLPLGPMDAPSLGATLEACGQGLVFAPDVIPAQDLLAQIGWQAMSASDAPWYLAIETQGFSGWVAYAEALTDAELAQFRWITAYEEVRTAFDADLASGLMFRHATGGLLRLLADRGECVLFLGAGDAAASAYATLPDVIDATTLSAVLDARINPAALDAGGLYEGNQIDTAAMSDLFAVDFQIGFVFLTRSPAAN